MLPDTIPLSQTHSNPTQMDVSIEWIQEQNKFSGIASIDLPSDPKIQSIGITLPLNLLAFEKSSQSREKAESFASAYLPIQNRYFVKNTSTLVKKIQLSLKNKTKSDCVTLTPIETKALKVKWISMGTHLEASMDDVISPARRSCLQLMISFDSFINSKTGNTNVNSKGEGIVTIPLFPIVTSELARYTIRSKNLNVACFSCLYSDKDNSVSMIGVPPPLEFYRSPKLGISLRSFGNLRLEAPDDLDLQELSQFLEPILQKFPLFTEKLEKDVHIKIRTNILEDLLVLQQKGEIQLGKGYLKTNAFFKEFHYSAFHRAILNQWILGVILSKNATRNGAQGLREHQIALTVSRFLAEKILRLSSKNLDFISELSKKFDFLPYFNEILKGRGLQNNSVYLGKEEESNATDTSPFFNLFPTRSGSVLQKTSAWCLNPETKQLFENSMDIVLFRPEYFEHLILGLQKMKSEKCPDFDKYFVNTPRDEDLSVEVHGRTAAKSEIVVKSQKGAAKKKPLILEDYYETKNLEVTNKQKPLASIKLSSEDYKQEIDTESQDVTATINSPHQEKTDRLQFPRKSEWLLTGFRLRFDSLSRQLDLEQGLSYRILGDSLQREFQWKLGYINRFAQLGASVKFDLLSNSPFSESENSGPENTNAKIWQSAASEFSLDRLKPTQIPLTLGIRYVESKPVQAWFDAIISFRSLNSSIILPSGVTLDLMASKGLTGQSASQKNYLLGTSFQAFIPIALYTTWAPQVSLYSQNPVKDLAGKEGLLGFSPEDLQASRSILTRNEIRFLLFKFLKFDILKTVVFDHALLFVSQNYASELKYSLQNTQKNRSIQNVEGGLRLIGTLLGSKDQSLSFVYASPYSKTRGPVYSIKIGQF